MIDRIFQVDEKMTARTQNPLRFDDMIDGAAWVEVKKDSRIFFEKPAPGSDTMLEVHPYEYLGFLHGYISCRKMTKPAVISSEFSGCWFVYYEVNSTPMVAHIGKGGPKENKAMHSMFLAAMKNKRVYNVGQTHKIGKLKVSSLPGHDVHPTSAYIPNASDEATDYANSFGSGINEILPRTIENVVGFNPHEDLYEDYSRILQSGKKASIYGVSIRKQNETPDLYSVLTETVRDPSRPIATITVKKVFKSTPVAFEALSRDFFKPGKGA